MAEQAPFVSVIVPTYNRARYTGEALDSILAQTFPDFEAVIVDDGSTDDTLDVIRPYLSDSRFKLIQQANQGTAAARNTAISHARGEWIAFLDCDDLWLPRKLALQAEVIRSYPRAALIFGNGIEFDEERDIGPFFRKREVFPDGADLRRVLTRNCFWTSSVMVRRRDVLEVGMLRADASGVDDYDLWLKVLERGGETRGVWEPVVRYRKRKESQGTNKAVMFGRLLRVYEEACERLDEPCLKAVAQYCVARARADLLMVKARESLGEGSSGLPACRRYMYAAWRECPANTKPLRLLLMSLIGRRRSVAKALARKW